MLTGILSPVLIALFKPILLAGIAYAGLVIAQHISALTAQAKAKTNNTNAQDGIDLVSQLLSTFGNALVASAQTAVSSTNDINKMAGILTAQMKTALVSSVAPAAEHALSLGEQYLTQAAIGWLNDKLPKVPVLQSAASALSAKPAPAVVSAGPVVLQAAPAVDQQGAP